MFGNVTPLEGLHVTGIYEDRIARRYVAFRAVQGYLVHKNTPIPLGPP